IFKIEDQLYRIMRSTRKKGKKKSESSLEFQVLSENGYKSITGKTIKESQNRIIEIVKMDYQTFINSAFILQGKADQFTTKSPIERKKILAEILNLKQFDTLQERAKDKLKEIENDKVAISKETEKYNEIIQDEELVREKLSIDRMSLENSANDLVLIESDLSWMIEEKENYKNELSILKQIDKVYHDNKNTLELLNRDLEKLKNEIINLDSLIVRKEEIEAKYNKLNNFKKENDIYSDKLIKTSEIENKINTLKTEINNQRNDIKIELQKLQERSENYHRDQLEHEKVIKDKDKVLEAIDKLTKAKETENEYQNKSALSQKLTQKKVLLDKKLQLEIQEIKISESKITTQISERKLQIDSVKDIKEQLEKINSDLAEIERKIVLRDNIKENGTKLGANIENNNKLIAQKQEEIKVYSDKIKHWSDFHEANCPMCSRSLDEIDRKKIIEKYGQDIQAIEYEIEKINIENSLAQKKKEDYRNDYTKLSSEIKARDVLQKQLGEYEKMLSNAKIAEEQINELQKKLSLLSDKITNNNINHDLQTEILEVENQIITIDYNPEKLSLIQAEVNNWKWAEGKIDNIKSSESTLNKIIEVLPKLDLKITSLKDSLENNIFAKDKESELNSLTLELSNIAYKKEEHQILRESIINLKDYDSYWNQLQQSITRSVAINEELFRMDKNKIKLDNDILENSKKVEKIPSLEEKLTKSTVKLDEKNQVHLRIRKENNELTISVSKNTEKIEQFSKFKESMKENQDKQEKLDYEVRLYKELVNAFGKKGIQSVIIENAIPEIENAANELLNRITEGRMHISFNTRKENKTNDKITETLDIFISDELGTRNYEMYSGGEAFRVNFAIRLALSKLLARRSGTKLKTLVIDEGFGTQDAKGISRLIESINTVSADFEKILIITHMNELKEAFPTKLEVYKTIDGSKVKLFH
ncbi:MAG: hypothetical protein H7263_02335, partial [Candidatus Sericytochromatia bacterium]|nr:hypothetical protein [Candidatus Sericytochromatia bacterium]